MAAGGASAQDGAAAERELVLRDTLQRLEQRGPQAVGGAVRVLSGLALEPGDGAADALGELDAEERERVLALLGPLPHESLAVQLGACAARAETEGTASGLLRVLERFGCADELALAARTAAGVLDGAHAPADLDERLREAALAILRRDEAAYRWLSSLVLGLRGDAALALVLATGDAGSPLGMAELAGTLGWDAELDVVTLAQIGRLAEQSLHPAQAEVRDAVRAQLRSGEVALVREAAVVAGRLDDHDALETLVELLEHPDPDLREACLWSLRRVSGQTLSGEAQRWRTWLWMEQRWLAYTAPVLIDDLDAADEARVVRALNELSRHRLHRDTLAVEVTTALRDPRASIRRLACTALARLGSRSCLESLVAALDDPDEGVAEEAWASLRALTGRGLPPDPQVWAVVCVADGAGSLPRER